MKNSAVPDSYKIQECCASCRFCFVHAEYDDPAIYFCKFDKSKRPLYTEEFDKWEEEHEVSKQGKCANWKKTILLDLKPIKTFLYYDCSVYELVYDEIKEKLYFMVDIEEEEDNSYWLLSCCSFETLRWSLEDNLKIKHLFSSRYVYKVEENMELKKIYFEEETAEKLFSECTINSIIKHGKQSSVEYLKEIEEKFNKNYKILE